MSKTYICPVCHVQVKDLKGHTERMHPEQVESSSTRKAPKSTGKTLELKVEKKETKEKEQEAKYHCIECGATVVKGQNPCPKCGATLDWSQV